MPSRRPYSPYPNPYHETYNNANNTLPILLLLLLLLAVVVMCVRRASFGEAVRWT